jgi:hypothetical protein
MGINAFSSSIVILTSDGFEILSLDDPQPSPVPHWKEPNLSDAEIGPEIRHELSSSTPLGMFLFRGGTFNPSVTSLCVYDTFALYMTGSRAVYGSKLIQFSGRAKRATARGGYLLLFHEDFVEIRAMYDGSLKQIISGKEIICIDDGTANGGNVKMAMQHPKNALLQVILEVVLYADTDQSQASFA